MNHFHHQHASPSCSTLVIPVVGTADVEVRPMFGDGTPSVLSPVENLLSDDKSAAHNNKKKVSRICTSSTWVTGSTPLEASPSSTDALALGFSDGTVCVWNVPKHRSLVSVRVLSARTEKGVDASIRSLATVSSQDSSVVGNDALLLALTAKSLHVVNLARGDAYHVSSFSGSADAQGMRLCPTTSSYLLVAGDTRVSLYALDRSGDCARGGLSIALVREFTGGHSGCPSAAAFLTPRADTTPRFITSDAVQPTLSLWCGSRRRCTASVTCSMPVTDIQVCESRILTTHAMPYVCIWKDSHVAGDNAEEVIPVSAATLQLLCTIHVSNDPPHILQLSRFISLTSVLVLTLGNARNPLCAYVTLPPASASITGLEMQVAFDAESIPSLRKQSQGKQSQKASEGKTTQMSAGVDLPQVRVQEDPEVALSRFESERAAELGAAQPLTLLTSNVRTILQYITSCNYDALRDTIYEMDELEIRDTAASLPSSYCVEFLRIISQDLGMDPMTSSYNQKLRALTLWLRCLLQQHGAHLASLPYIHSYFSTIRVSLAEHTRHRRALESLHTRLMLFNEIHASAEAEALLTETGLDSYGSAVQNFIVEENTVKRWKQ